MTHDDSRQSCQPALLHPAQQQTMWEAHRLTLSQALAALEAVTERFEGYEPRTVEGCEAAETALAFAARALEDESLFLEDEGPQVVVTLLCRTLDVIDETRMLLSTYRPICHSRKLAHLKRRRLLRFRLEQITSQTRAVLAGVPCTIERTPPREEVL